MVQISIHALRVEGDLVMLLLCLKQEYFYPRPPCGGRLKHGYISQAQWAISIQANSVEGDCGL